MGETGETFERAFEKIVPPTSRYIMVENGNSHFSKHYSQF